MDDVIKALVLLEVDDLKGALRSAEGPRALLANTWSLAVRVGANPTKWDSREEAVGSDDERERVRSTYPCAFRGLIVRHCGTEVILAGYDPYIESNTVD